MKSYFNKFYMYLKKDTWDSWIVSLILIIVFIKLVFFPVLSLILGTSLPLVVIESCSMYHSSGFESWWNSNEGYYETRGISNEQFKEFGFKDGLNKGDIILLWGHSDIVLGDVIVFNADTIHPLIHRVVETSPLGTKGDNNSDQLSIEKNISESKVIGKSVFRIPFIGWVKLIFFEPFREKSQRGFCT